MSRYQRRNRNNLIFGLLLLFGGAWLLIQSPIHLGFPRTFLGLFSFTGLLHVVLAVWVGVDAHRRRMNGVLWGLLVCFTSVVGLIVYLIVVQSPTLRNGLPGTQGAAAPHRPGPNGSGHCGSCGSRVRRHFRHCPHCGQSLGVACPACGQAVSPDWQVCPRCQHALSSAATAPAGGVGSPGGGASTPATDPPGSGQDPTGGAPPPAGAG